MNSVWVIAIYKERSCGWNQTEKTIELNQEGLWREGQLSPAFQCEDDARAYITKLPESSRLIHDLRPVKLAFWGADIGYLAEPYQESQNEPEPSGVKYRDQLVEELLPKLNALFGIEDKR
jgi:hypothetical protein